MKLPMESSAPETRKRGSHGPEFVRVFVELLVAFAGYNPAELLSGLSSGTRRVKVAGTMDLPWRSDRSDP